MALWLRRKYETEHKDYIEIVTVSNNILSNRTAIQRKIAVGKETKTNHKVFYGNGAVCVV